MAERSGTRRVRFAAFMSWLVSGTLNCLYRVRVSGTAHVPQTGPFILIANHGHVFDPLVIHRHVTPWVHWVTKRELFHNPVIRFVLRGVGTIPFNRESLDVAALRTIIRVVKEDGVVGIFPQGGRVVPEDRDRVLPKEATAHLARRFKLPIVPVAVANEFRLFGKTRPHLIFGPPFTTDTLSLNDEAAAVQMMRIVYALMDQPYCPGYEVPQA